MPTTTNITGRSKILEQSKKYEAAIVLYREEEFGETKMGVHGFRMELSGMLYDLFKADPVSASIAESVLARLKKEKPKKSKKVK